MRQREKAKIVMARFPGFDIAAGVSQPFGIAGGRAGLGSATAAHIKSGAMEKDRSFDLIAEPRTFDLTAVRRWDSTVFFLVPGCPLYPACPLFPSCRTYPQLEAEKRVFGLEAEDRTFELTAESRTFNLIAE